ncbi:hypothetical protein, partial [Ruminococcus albus]|uniref:hypothetical protein n=1 Tax=Ruminococcus albus TaxID=1264 RepID=UPI001A99BD80
HGNPEQPSIATMGCCKSCWTCHMMKTTEMTFTNKIKTLKEKVHRLQEEKTLMAKRDCQELLLRAENKRLKEQLADRDKTIYSLRCTIIRKKN